jgi:hypothetical protein
VFRLNKEEKGKMYRREKGLLFNSYFMDYRTVVFSGCLNRYKKPAAVTH